MPRVAVHIVTYNSEANIDACLASVLAQDHRDFSVTVIDNASTDATLNRLHRWDGGRIRVEAHPKNDYFARAHNDAIRASDADIVLTLNPDAMLRPDFLSHIVRAFDISPRIGSVNGKLLLTTSPLDPSVLDAGTVGCRIDSAGIGMRRSRRPYLRGSGAPSESAFLVPGYIFGVDAAAGAYRRAMLEDARIDGEYFDEDFVMYREDVDLAWRAQILGWDTYYAPQAVGFHVRSFHVGGRRRHIPPNLRRHSVANGWLLLLKHDRFSALARDLPAIAPYQMKIAAGLVLTEQSSIPAVADLARLVPRALAKRRAIERKRRRTPEEVEKWLE